MTLAFWLMFALAAGWALCAGVWREIAIKARKENEQLAHNRLDAEKRED